jgi:hypothetical protein
MDPIIRQFNNMFISVYKDSDGFLWQEMESDIESEDESLPNEPLPLNHVVDLSDSEFDKLPFNTEKQESFFAHASNHISPEPNTLPTMTDEKKNTIAPIP